MTEKNYARMNDNIQRIQATLASFKGNKQLVSLCAVYLGQAAASYGMGQVMLAMGVTDPSLHRPLQQSIVANIEAALDVLENIQGIAPAKKRGRKAEEPK